jgi:pimeloyl-ACP methyl ester carboxylesterase
LDLVRRTVHIGSVRRWEVALGLVVRESGLGSPRVVFVHGVLDRGRSFERVAALLEDECRMLWYDRRGYGDSIDAPGGPVGVHGHIDDLVGVLDGEPAVVVGHSFGGVTVVGAALRAPELVRAVVLYETGFAWAPGWDDSPVQALLAGEDPEGAGVRNIFPRRYDSMSDDERSQLRREAAAFLAEERSVRTGTAPYDIADLAVPLVFGSSGVDRFAAVADHLRRVVAEVETVIVPGGGHNPHRTAPEAFADLVRRGISLAAR